MVIPSASRIHIGTYYCIASNGVPPTKSKSIELKVQCKKNKFQLRKSSPKGNHKKIYSG